MSEEAMRKAWRLIKIERLLFRHPQGYRSSELARIFHVDQRTINRDLQDLQSTPFYLPLVQEPAPDWRWHLMDGARFTLPPLRLTLEQGASLYLAARLLQRAIDEHNPVIERAIEALAEVLPSEIGGQVQRLITRGDGLAHDDRGFLEVFKTITLGWATGRVVHIWHRSAGSENVHDYDLHPYLIEASAVGYATYVIGWASWFDEIHTFKLERIQKAELMESTFSVPQDFDPVNLLRTAWGIAYAASGEALERVRLRFSPDVTRRVKESVWHTSQQIEDLPEGGCILTVEVGHAWEMVPWIRGWGPDCEVLAPQELRKQVAAEMRRAAEMYEEANSANGD
jgi:predicted DNA-binding transcriptional regulator YafY